MTARVLPFLSAGIALAFAPTRSWAAVADAAMVGAWSGTAEIVVNWTTQRVLHVEFTIAPDGTVSGRIGDATLTDGRLERNRGALGRALNVKTDFIITGRLIGQVIAAEGVRRDGVKLPLNWTNARFEGGLHTSGSAFGGKEKMILSARRLKLEKKAPTP